MTRFFSFARWNLHTVLLVGYKNMQLKIGDWECLWPHVSWDILFHGKQIFLLFISCCKTEYPEMISQSLPVSCIHSHSFVPHQKWNFMFLVLQKAANKKFCHIQSLLFKAVFVSNSTSGLTKIKGYTGGKFSKYLPLLIILFLGSPK